MYTVNSRYNQVGYNEVIFGPLIVLLNDSIARTVMLVNSSISAKFCELKFNLGLAKSERQ